jgi:hypothetical protein
MASSSTRTASAIGITGRAFEYKCGQHGAKLVNGGGIIAIQHHIATPVTHSDYEIGWSLPLSENLQNALLGILVFDRLALVTR